MKVNLEFSNLLLLKSSFVRRWKLNFESIQVCTLGGMCSISSRASWNFKNKKQHCTNPCLVRPTSLLEFLSHLARSTSAYHALYVKNMYIKTLANIFCFKTALMSLYVSWNRGLRLLIHIDFYPLVPMQQYYRVVIMSMLNITIFLAVSCFAHMGTALTQNNTTLVRANLVCTTRGTTNVTSLFNIVWYLLLDE